MHIHLPMSAKETKSMPGLVAGTVCIAQSRKRSTASPHTAVQSIFSISRVQKEQPNSSSPQETALSSCWLPAPAKAFNKHTYFTNPSTYLFQVMFLYLGNAWLSSGLHLLLSAVPPAGAMSCLVHLYHSYRINSDQKPTLNNSDFG